MLITLVNILLQFAHEIGYWGVVFLMAIESSFIPFPSEIVIPPAAYLAAQGSFNIWLVVGAGVLGSLIGALINYFLAFYLGRPLIYRLIKTKWAKFLLLKPEQLEKSEKLFFDYSRSSTFFGRLVPVVRQLISLAAGFAKMPLSIFILYTFLGSALWTAVLAALGYFFGANEELWKKYYTEISWGLVIFAFIFFSYLIYKRRKE